jgi:hypothetical protein
MYYELIKGDWVVDNTQMLQESKNAVDTSQAATTPPRNLYLPEFLKIVPPDWMVAKKFVAKTLSSICEKQPIAAVYKLGDYTSALAVTILGADDQHGLVMQPIDQTSLVDFIDSNCLLVLCDDNGKYQFLIQQIRLLDGMMLAPLPNDIMKISRREDFRVQGPVDANFKLILHLGAGQELETKVINISQNGVLIDIRKTALQPEVGRIWFDAYFERLKSKSGKFNLMVKNIMPSAAIDRIRCGCLLQEPSKKTLTDFHSTCQAISDSRASGTLNRWYQDVDWI